MKTSTYLKTMFFLGLAGFLFSGYLSAIKLFTSTCAFNEPCPYFLGYPACWYGFGMFLIIFSSTILGLLKKISEKVMTKIIFMVSLIGILFAGYFVIPEIKNILIGIQGAKLSTCTYGFVFYIIIFIVAIYYLIKNKSLPAQDGQK